jgi:hypothetical protein
MSDLIEILQQIHKRPGMYFGSRERARSIHVIQAFIMGYEAAKLGTDSPSELGCFNEWVAIHYHVFAEGRGGFILIIEHVGGDERLAFDEFFRILPEFVRDKQQLGRDAIISRFCEVQDELFEAFSKNLKNE